MARTAIRLAFCGLVFAFVFGGRPAVPEACAALSRLPIANTRLLARAAPPAARGEAASCRVSGTITPAPGSRIGFEVWMPQRGWNGRFEMLGSGGYASALPYPYMTALLRAGYAVAATDTGHQGPGPEFAAGRPQSIVDFGWRAVHLSATAAKATVAAYYGRPAQRAYFQGCSTGGQQGLMEAQRFPDDFDGIVAGAPAYNRTRLSIGFLWQFVQNHRPDQGGDLVIPREKLPAITRAAIAACRDRNGGAAGGLASDPYLDDPLACRFDPARLQCKGPDRADCLTAPQVAALRRMYAGASNPRTGERIYFGWPPGSEASQTSRDGWQAYWAAPGHQDEPVWPAVWRDWVFRNADWSPWSFDFDKDVAVVDTRLARDVNATSPDLEAFRRRGGKLIHFHGGSDPVIPIADSVAYHERVVADQRVRRGLGSEGAARTAAADFYRLFLAPGVDHCGGGLGPAPANLQAAIEAWVEHGHAPDQILAAPGGVMVKGRATRPLCPYPQVARYDGKGPSDQAASFRCAAPQP